MADIFRFKTNVKCEDCVSKITPFLNNRKEIEKWEVDTNSPDKTLTVSAEGITDKEIATLVKEAGYKAEVF